MENVTMLLLSTLFFLNIIISLTSLLFRARWLSTGKKYTLGNLTKGNKRNSTILTLLKLLPGFCGQLPDETEVCSFFFFFFFDHFVWLSSPFPRKKGKEKKGGKKEREKKRKETPGDPPSNMDGPESFWISPANSQSGKIELI